jgi:hypothetical protein
MLMPGSSKAGFGSPSAAGPPVRPVLLSYLTGLARFPGGSVEAAQALAAAAAADAFASGATLVHANPDSADDDEVLASLNPIEVPGFVIRLAAA